MDGVRLQVPDQVRNRLCRVTTQKKISSHLHAASHKFEILQHEDSVKYLGRKVSFQDPSEAEFSNRIAKARSASGYAS